MWSCLLLHTTAAWTGRQAGAALEHGHAFLLCHCCYSCLPGEGRWGGGEGGGNYIDEVREKQMALIMCVCGVVWGKGEVMMKCVCVCDLMGSDSFRDRAWWWWFLAAPLLHSNFLPGSLEGGTSTIPWPWPSAATFLPCLAKTKTHRHLGDSIVGFLVSLFGFVW